MVYQIVTSTHNVNHSVHRLHTHTCIQFSHRIITTISFTHIRPLTVFLSWQRSGLCCLCWWLKPVLPDPPQALLPQHFCHLNRTTDSWQIQWLRQYLHTYMYSQQISYLEDGIFLYKRTWQTYTPFSLCICFNKRPMFSVYVWVCMRVCMHAHVCTFFAKNIWVYVWAQNITSESTSEKRCFSICLNTK